MSVCNTTIAEAWVATDFCAYQLPVSINQVRSVISVGVDDFLALERASQSVVYAWDSDGDGLAESRKVLASASSLNHGLAVRDGYIYASSSSHVYRWPLVPSATTTTTNSSSSSITNNNSDNTTQMFDEETTVGDMETVVDNINRDGSGGAPFGHTTRTLAFDEQGLLYVSVGSNDNVDPDSFRSRIRRFDIDDPDLYPLNFLDGLVFADGLRNEVGLAFDAHGDLWGVENSADRLFREDLGGDIHTDNPAEELNRFKEEDVGKNWGYPKCWTEFKVPEPQGLGQGTIWAWPSFLNEGKATDEECRANTIPPVMSLQGHSAPLGITFYEWKPPEARPSECPPNVAFPAEMDGSAFIAYHGSWNRDIPTGYKVVYVEMDEDGDPIGSDPLDLLMHNPPDATWDNGFRPVDVDFDDCGRLLISSDGTRSMDYGGSGIVRMESAPGTFAPTKITFSEEGTSASVPSNSSSATSEEVFSEEISGQGGQTDENSTDAEELTASTEDSQDQKISNSTDAESVSSPTSTGSRVQVSSGAMLQAGLVSSIIVAGTFCSNFFS